MGAENIYGEGILRVSTVLDFMPQPKALNDWMAFIGPGWDEVREFEADVGTYFHSAVETICVAIKQGTFTPDLAVNAVRCPARYKRKVTNAFNSWFVHFSKLELFQPHSIEETLYHPDLPFAGTKDFYGTYGGEWVLLDWKSSRRFYDKYKFQLAAYLELHEKCNPDEPVDKLGVVICDKEGKNEAQITWFTPEDLQPYREWFLLMVEPARLYKELAAD